MSIRARGSRVRLSLLAVALQLPLLDAARAQPAPQSPAGVVETIAAGAPTADPRGHARQMSDLPPTTGDGVLNAPLVEPGVQGAVVRDANSASGRLHTLQFDGVPLSDAMKLFAAETGINVVCSAESARTVISVYLRDVEPIAALEAIVKANGLFYRVDDQSGIYRIATAEEYEKDLTSFREEQTRVFTLLYPNPIAVAQVIGQIYGNRVEANTADADQDALSDLHQRFNRFDLVDGRALGLGTFDGNDPSLADANPFALGRNGMMQGGALAPAGLAGGAWNPTFQRREVRDEAATALSAVELQEIENQIARAGGDADRARLLGRKATIYVSTIRRNNQIVVRTADMQSMAEIEQLVQQLDVPTPTVLLEVKVLRVELADGMNSAFEYFAGQGKAAVGYSGGDALPGFPGAGAATQALAGGLGVAGNVPGSLTFQIIDSNFRYRMQLLESQSRVTALATPLILTANNEVSRIFVGDTLPFTVGFAPSRVIGGPNSVAGAVAATPITELRDVGQSLLVTPSINADRTVTLRVVEENSERVLGGASIPVPDVDGTGVTTVNVDTVRRRTVSGTIVARDGMAVALGGLIEEKNSDRHDQVPVLGDLPGIGFLFRRQSTGRSRTELVVMIRPYVFNTPSESAASCQTLLGDLSIHPNSPHATGTMNTFSNDDGERFEQECRERAKLFRFHSVRGSCDDAHPSYERADIQ